MFLHDGTDEDGMRTADGTADGRHARVTPREGPPAPDSAASMPVVLVVDDDAGLRAAVRRALERRSYSVVEAVGGRDALASLADGLRVDYVLTDLLMADGSGGWLLAQIGYEYPHLLPRTVVMTGDSAAVAAAHLATRWRCPVLTKPFTAPLLAGTLAGLAHQPD